MNGTSPPWRLAVDTLAPDRHQDDDEQDDDQESDQGKGKRIEEKRSAHDVVSWCIAGDLLSNALRQFQT
jgi:hypothetical protein